MMKAIQYLVLFLLAILLTESCQKIDFPTPEAENIVGEWEWVYSKGGITGSQVINAEDSEETYRLRFNEKGRYKYCINNKTEERGSYTVDLSSESWGDYLTLLLDDKSKSALSGELAFRGADTLTIYPLNCADCHRAFYVRK